MEADEVFVQIEPEALILVHIDIYVIVICIVLISVMTDALHEQLINKVWTWRSLIDWRRSVLQLELTQIVFVALQLFKELFLCNLLYLGIVLGSQAGQELLEHCAKMLFEVIFSNLIIAEVMRDHGPLGKLRKSVSAWSIERERTHAHVLHLSFLGSCLLRKIDIRRWWWARSLYLLI